MVLQKKESSKIQKKNSKNILKSFSFLKKLVKFLNKNNIKFGNVFYVENLSKKKNNNDFLIEALFDIYFSKNKNKLAKIISYSSDFLGLENSLNNMCDFRENKCVSCRERNIDRVIGCCQKNCKYTHTGVCTVKNISCKLYMCDYLENRGYYFSPYYLPITKKYLTLVQRFACKAMLFKSLNFQIKTLKTVLLSEILFFAIILLFIII